MKYMKALNLLRVIANTSSGADQSTLLHLSRALIRSKLDHGCIVYGSARLSYLKMLDPIHNSALRLCLGAFRTSPTSSMSVMPVNLRFSSDSRNPLCTDFAILCQIFAVQSIAVSSTHSLKSSLLRTSERTKFICQ